MFNNVLCLESRNDRRPPIASGIGTTLQGSAITAEIGDNSAEMGDNSAEIGDGAAGIVDIATNMIPC